MHMMQLPEKYLNEMKNILKDEFDLYLNSFNEEHITSLRVNESKISIEEFLKIFPYPLEQVPWCHNGFYYRSTDPVTKHPYYYAGLYYIQEASAMLPAETLPVEENDRVLDVCAAPGGKSTELGVKLKDSGVLISNDISYSRCQALLKNLERFGIRNAYVISESPDKLEHYFDEYFDKILIDAPCSGEGMFRKDASLIEAWKEKDSSCYVPIQKSIMQSALKMLKPGGYIVYSTCTFSKEEDEEIIQYALSLDDCLEVIPLPYVDGFVQNAYGTKLFPHRIHGEGHFVSLLRKKGDKKENRYCKETVTFDEGNIHACFSSSKKLEIKDRMYACRDTGVNLDGLRIMRSGVLLAEKKKGRIECNEILPMYLKVKELKNCISLHADDIRVIKYLKGETIDVKDQVCKDGLNVICVDGFPLGFVKCSKGICKNKYPKAWILK